ncbi:competence protein CoiA family protein [Streptomyces sp. NPDC058052]|uniref:competence protein CoiA family protein n=1 Tax=Streptomyces sp. NPDC058052 TaxID=3346316 RepID=UPI0036E24D40
MSPSADEEDTRKVQTAVLGRSGSDVPAFLPFDHDDFDIFMRGRSREDFYCGILLGGCGKKLTAKRYLEKKCHFAHRPPVHCRRTANGESSADHLYIGKALQEWLSRSCGHPGASVTYPDLGSGPGGAVEVRFGGGRLIRVQMGRAELKTWRSDRERLDLRHPRGVHWAYGPDSGLAHNEVEVSGHAVRLSCRTEQGTRKVYVGTQRPGHPVAWATLAECRLTDAGVITPALAATADPVPASPAGPAFPLRPGSVAFTGAVEDPSARTDRTRFYEADVQPEGSAATRGRIGLPSQAPVPPPHAIHVLTGVAHLCPREEGGWLIRADAATPLPHRADPRWPDLRPAAPPEPARPPATTEEAMVAAFRTKLEQVRRARGLIDWETLVAQAGAVPGDFTPADRVRILVAVDTPHTPGEPFLAAVVKSAHAAPGPASFFADVLAAHGMGEDLTEAQVDHLWRYSARQRATATERPVREARADKAGADEAGADEARADEARTDEARTDEAGPDGEPDPKLVAELRKHLKLMAKGRGLITWKGLLAGQGILHTTISVTTRFHLLVAIDSPWKPGKPVLSALVKEKGKDGPDAMFGAVLKALGWTPSAAVPSTDAAWPLERDRVYAAAKNWNVSVPGTAGPAAGRYGLTKRLKGKVDDVRRALIQAATREACLGWNALAVAAGMDPGLLTDAERTALLVAVDRRAPAEGLLLSSLVIGPGHTPVPYFDDILRALGRPHGLLPIELGRVRKQEQARVFEAYGRRRTTTTEEG